MTGHARDRAFLTWLKTATLLELRLAYRAVRTDTPEWRIVAIERAIDRFAPETPRDSSVEKV